MTILDDAPVTETPVDTEQVEVQPGHPKRSAARRLWRAFGTLITVVAVVVGLGAVVLALSSHEAAPGDYVTFGHPVMSVLSGSMTPTIRTGDLVIDDSVTMSQAQHLKVGQIISFRVGSDVFTHRIHGIRHVDGQIAYQTKGDANNAPDQPLVFPSAVLGVYSGKVPFGGYVLNALHKPVVLALLLAAPILWLLSTWLFGKAREAEVAGAGGAVLEVEAVQGQKTDKEMDK